LRKPGTIGIAIAAAIRGEHGGPGLVAMHLNLVDLLVIVLYAVFVLTVAQIWKKSSRRGDEEQGYAQTKRAIPWWMIGTSLIAANISAEQIIGMSGSAYALGIGIAAYEWLAAFALIVIGKYFLPVYMKNQISTMPQFLRLRYGSKTQVTMALMWMGLYTFVSLTAIMWLGATAVHVVTGLSVGVSIVLLGLVAGNYALYAGLKSSRFTDVAQVSLLVLGGLAISVFSLEKIAETAGAGGGVSGLFSGFDVLSRRLPEHFDMILQPSNPYYKYLPGTAVLFGGMWIINIVYWGFNQYIVQNALAARSIREVQKGVILAAFLKLLMPVLVVLPGLAAAFLLPHLGRFDEAYPRLMITLPHGLLGFVFVALVAAIVASMGSTLSSVATILSMDVVKVVRSDASNGLLMIVGRFAAIAVLVVAMAVSTPLLGHVDQAFQFIQEYTGFFSPGIMVIFGLGMFWPKANETGALLAAGGTLLVSAAFAIFLPEMPFMQRMGYVFLICLALAVGGSLATASTSRKSQIDVSGIDYSTDAFYNLAGVAVVALLAAIYWYWW
jgi:SSS family solute:Na+ symporter